MKEISKKIHVKAKYAVALEWIIYSGKKNSKYFLHFITGQFLLQGFNLLNGFFLLRWLSIDQQAKFSIAFSIQTLIIFLSDLGFTGSIIALVGSRIHNKKLVGSYIQSARHLRNYLLLFSCLVTLVVLPFILKKQSWSYSELTLILIPVLFSVRWQASCSLYDSTLVMHKKMKDLYKPQVGVSAFKLLTNFILHITGTISALTTLVLNAIAVFYNATFFKKKALPYIDLSVKNYDSELKEMIHYLKPMFPSLVFNALYGQIQIFIISFFGKATNIAEVAALGKLAQLFLFLGSVNGAIIAPLIARTSSKELIHKYFVIITITFLFTICIIFSSFLMPDFYLFLLGPKYYHLKTELNLMIINSCLSYIGNVMWTMHSARKWIFWWGTWSYMICVITCQIIGIMLFNITTTHGVLAISTLTLACMLLVHAQTAFVGFYKEIRQDRDFSLPRL